MRLRNLEAEMARIGITQEALANAVKVSGATISNYVTCKTAPSIYDAAAIKKALGVDIPIEVLFEAVD